MARRAEVERQTAETKVKVSVDINGTGKVQVETGIGFFDHMLKTLLRHAWFDATVWAQGDTHVDDHHTVEDTGIVLGQAIDKALGERKGVQRFASAIVPMDEALVLCSVDLSGRGGAFVELPKEGKVGNFDVELAAEFFRALATNARITLHLKTLSGENKHHILEAAFKACAVALRQAVAIVPHIAEQVPSTKETLV
ncbi:MAG: imidazoleglycerol-phosphate dehydratase HisB [Armatimonadetes bacterium]|nr:imidazoleglycerol-phosphate dehydratase HisB [Armatimonadota bacterium]MDW8028442.1 imidazoleglycerol-phosphate dehydratase HisB [Armatimonadota bacterium]